MMNYITIVALVAGLAGTLVYSYKVKSGQTSLTSAQLWLYYVMPPDDLYGDRVKVAIDKTKSKYEFTTKFVYPGTYDYGVYVETLADYTKPPEDYFPKGALAGRIVIKTSKGEHSYPFSSDDVSVFGGLKKGFAFGRFEVGDELPIAQELTGVVVFDAYQHDHSSPYGSLDFFITKGSVSMEGRY